MVLTRDHGHPIVTWRRPPAVDELLSSPAVRLVAEAAWQREQRQAGGLVDRRKKLAIVATPSLAPVVANAVGPIVESEAAFPVVGMGPRTERSEERRVGKEGRARGTA